MTEEREKTVRDLIDKTEIKLLTAINNGLFNQNNIGGKETWIEIEKILGESRNLLEEKKYEDAETKQATASGHLYHALSMTSAYWKFVNVHAGPIWIYLLGVLVLEFLFFYTDLDAHFQNKLDVSIDFLYVVAWGVAGGILRALWKIKTSIGGNKHRRSFTIYYLSSPFLGGIFGAITYLLIIGGLVSISGDISPTSITPILPIAAFAGYNWEWAVGLFSRIADVISVKSKSD
ncbi:MAG: hypothetical protein OES19_02840 [Nitrosopumilus sp.]|nr:hypothetical protein [Nitrosopumilus sp.]